MGLKLWKHNQDRQTAEDHIIVFPSAGLAKVRPVFFEPYKTKQFVPKKANPSERWTRKTMGLKPFLHGHDRQVTENEQSRFQTFYKRKRSGCSYEGVFHGIQIFILHN